MLAVIHAGGVAIPLSPLYPDREIRWLLQDAEADTVVASGHMLTRARTLPPELTVMASETFLAAGPERAAVPIREQDTALQLYTSGTTGKPKGVCITHANLCHQTRLIAEAWGLNSETTLLHCLPLHHMHGIAVALLPTLLAGGRVHMLPRFDAHAVWEQLGNSNTFMAVPTMYRRLIDAYDEAKEDEQRRWKRAAQALDLSTSGSAALPVTLAERWRDLHGAIPLERYGMTEIGVGLSNPRDAGERRQGHVGLPLDTVELRLVDDSGKEVEEGPGEIWIRGPSVFSHYWRRLKESEQSFHNGWFKTGDRAERKVGGSYRILGRHSVDILKSGGYKLSALEIEEVLREHPLIAETAVVGLDDPEWGQRVVAAIVSCPGAAPEKLDDAHLRRWMKEQLAPYKVPRHFLLVDSLPQNAVGKVLKPALALELAARLAQALR